MNRRATADVLHPLRVVRLARGMSTMEVAFRAGVNLRTVERIEAGEIASPRRSTLKVIADALGCEPEDLQPTEAAA